MSAVHNLQLAEDQPDRCFYRFVATTGKQQAMKPMPVNS